MKRLLFLLLTITAISSHAQNAISYPKRLSFNTTNYIKAEVPTDSSRANGLWLPQGIVVRNGVEQIPLFIPSNKPEWAVAIAVAWNMERNLIGRIAYPQMGSYLATAGLETQLRCATGLAWDSTYMEPAAYDPNVVYAAQINNGCFGIEGPGSYYSAIGQHYPGRFVSDQYDTLIEGVNGFVNSTLAYMYYNVATTITFDQYMGWDLFKSIDCTADHLAYVKTSGSLSNGGPNAFTSMKSVFFENGVADANNCWTGMSATVANYPNTKASFTAGLEQQSAHCDYPQGASKQEYYNDSIEYSTIVDYLKLIKLLYDELDLKNVVLPKVSATFDQYEQANGKIAFRDLGPVIDEIIFFLPKEYPVVLEGSPIGVNVDSKYLDGIPYGEITLVNGQDSAYQNSSVILGIKNHTMADSSYTYKWFNYKDTSITLSTEPWCTFSSSDTGLNYIGLKICNSNGCYSTDCLSEYQCKDTRIKCGFPIYVKPETITCSLGLDTLYGTAASCVGDQFDGTIKVKLNSPNTFAIDLSYFTTNIVKSTHLSSTNSDSLIISNLKGGNYDLKIYEVNDTNCLIRKNLTVTGAKQDFEVQMSFDSLVDCRAKIESKITPNNQDCRLRVRAYSKIYYQWENWVALEVKTNDNIIYETRKNKVYPIGTIDQWSNVDASEIWVDVSENDSISFGLALVPTPGAQQNYPYTIDISNANGVILFEVEVPNGTLNFNNLSHAAGSYTQASCAFNIADSYTFEWNPSLYSVTNTDSTSIGRTMTLLQHRTDHAVEVTSTSGCITRDTLRVIANPECIIATGINTINEDLVLFPNPSNGQFTIQGSFTGQVDITDLAGKVVHSFNKDTEVVLVNLEHLTSGLYLVKMDANNRQIVKRLVIR